MDANNILLFIFGQLVTGAAIWGGIRADLKSMHARLDEYHGDVQRAHRRIDDLYNGHKHSRDGNGQ